MIAPLVFMDTETTGLSLDDDIWEFAGIRRHPDGREIELHLFIDHDREKCARLPEAFYADHRHRYRHVDSVPQEVAARKISRFLAPDAEEGRAHIVGAVPNFDTERLALLLDEHGYPTGWHYHLVDVENLAVGWLAGQADANNGHLTPALPWDSDEISRAVGVEPPTDERHTAMGDARWARAIYDRVMGADQ